MHSEWRWVRLFGPRQFGKNGGGSCFFSCLGCSFIWSKLLPPWAESRSANVGWKNSGLPECAAGEAITSARECFWRSGTSPTDGVGFATAVAASSGSCGYTSHGSQSHSEEGGLRASDRSGVSGVDGRSAGRDERRTHVRKSSRRRRACQE